LRSRTFKSMIKNGILLFICGLSLFKLHGQDGSLEDLYENLYEVNQKDEIVKLSDRHKSIDKAYFSNEKSISYNLEPDHQWRLLFMRIGGWRQVVGQEMQDLTAYYLPEQMTFLTGRDITQMFELTGKPSENVTGYRGLSAKRYNISYAMSAENSPYAVVVLEHNYPHGNQTSWYREERYYFKKE